MKLRFPNSFPRNAGHGARQCALKQDCSFLTVLGIVIGVMAAIVVASILTGMPSIISIIEEYGTNNLLPFTLHRAAASTDRAELLQALNRGRRRRD